MTNEELRKILENHQHWLNEDCDGWEDMKADLRCADLRDANLSGADLSGAYLRGANLRCADLRCAKGGYFACPIEGEFVAWKKARLHGKSGGECIVKLLIPSDAKRLSSTSEKCRADKAMVLEVQDMDGNKINECAYSNYEHAQDFEYKVGETVTPREPFDDDRWNECSSGIHFFIDRRAAVEY